MPIRNLTALCAAIIWASPLVAQPQAQFLCASGATGVYAVFMSGTDSARALAILVSDPAEGGQTSLHVPLQQVPSGSGFRYSGGDVDFQGKGEEATLSTLSSGESVACTLASTPPRDVVPSE
ncbi:MliC family protein [Roseovarius sp. LXJ103]|uniref:MliC family protein n=1 Tax=Roseovarius carneus TaxID=2853164 RepID=UPI000D61CA65|nr:MliC family protein [Roseovarius carneus]MBZ8118653.1 MliC family protein [Roseovarius carneus]PWE35664.1 hypothetical protein DD563_06650 [Pelagicola sp. LXJ1103]